LVGEHELLSDYTSWFAFIEGFFIGTEATSAPDMDVCEETFSNFNESLYWGKYYRSEISTDFTNIFTANIYYLDIIIELDSGSSACYIGFLDSIVVMLGYNNWMSDMSIVTTNLMFNFGHIYDNLRDFVLYFTHGDGGTVETPY
jgi:hypothetical protein